MNKMRCPSYGFENASGIEFCGECGAPLKLKCLGCGCENARTEATKASAAGVQIGPAMTLAATAFSGGTSDVELVHSIVSDDSLSTKQV
jgi:hypothetical protein